jgi:hypothetical protein
MDTQVRTPQAIFKRPQRLLVPLFQLLFVWNEEPHENLCGRTSSAVAFVRKKSTNDRYFWRVESTDRRSLKDVRAECVESRVARGG